VIQDDRHEGGASAGMFLKSLQATGGDLGSILEKIKEAVPGLNSGNKDKK